MPISDEKRYEFVTRQLAYTNEKIIQAFGLFIKLITAIVGGLIWLKTQNLENSSLKSIITPIRMLFILIGTGSILLIILNLKSWWGFRKAEMQLASNVPLPKHICSYLVELIMIIIILSTICIAWKYTPTILINCLTKQSS